MQRTRLDPSVVTLEQLNDVEILVVDAAIETALRRVRRLRDRPVPVGKSTTHLINDLTRRQKDVLPLMTAGYSAREIGNILSISPRTVEIHRESILQKLGAQNVIDLVHLMHRMMERSDAE